MTEHFMVDAKTFLSFISSKLKTPSSQLQCSSLCSG